MGLAEAIGYDERIGRKFLNAGLGFGGGCLPKDIRAFMARAGELGADEALTFLREVDAINLRRRSRMVDLAREQCGGTLIGKRVASEKCTVVDNGTMPWRRGSLNVDDEGQPTQETVLIENGILKGYLSDKLSSKLMGLADTGNGRRESYEHIPMPRMTNTYMLAGQDDPGDIIRSVKNGVYAVNFGGGQVDITNGKFVFSASEAYLIEDGKITAPIKGATLIGNGPDVLTRVSMVGNDLKLDEGVGTCGKDGQAVPVGVGIPTIKIDRLTVGGTAKRETGGFMQ